MSRLPAARAEECSGDLPREGATGCSDDLIDGAFAAFALPLSFSLGSTPLPLSEFFSLATLSLYFFF